MGSNLCREMGLHLQMFGVGYTVVPGTVKQGQEYLRSDGQDGQ